MAFKSSKAKVWPSTLLAQDLLGSIPQASEAPTDDRAHALRHLDILDVPALPAGSLPIDVPSFHHGREHLLDKVWVAVGSPVHERREFGSHLALSHRSGYQLCGAAVPQPPQYHLLGQPLAFEIEDSRLQRVLLVYLDIAEGCQ
jgi:hypothetical protein